MRKKAPVIYYGNDPDLIVDMKKFFINHPGFDLKIEEYISNGIISKITGQVPLICIVDFSSLHDPCNIIEEIIYYKRIFPFKSTVFAGVFASKASLTELSLIFTSGFQFSLIKGCETELFLKDLLQLSTLEERGTQRFAEAKDINRPMPVGICSSVSQITELDYTIETDLPPCQDELTSALPFVSESKPQILKIISQTESSSLYPMSSQCKLQYPFASPWDTVSDEMLDPETIKTWLSGNTDELLPSKEFIKVFTHNKTLVSELFINSKDLPFHLHCTLELSPLWQEELHARRPVLIFFDTETIEEDIIPVIENFVSQIKTIEDYKPILIISRTGTSAPAFQKVFNYPQILSLPQQLDLSVMTNLGQTYMKKRNAHLHSIQTYAFRNSDTRRSVDVIFNPIINKLTEHSIDLSTQLEIPFYSVLHFSLPIDFYATIIPSKGTGELKGSTYTYHCLIHGLDEKQMSRLRQFVNQIIYSPIEDFSEASIKKTTEIKVAEEKPIIEKTIAPEPIKIEHHHWDEARKQIKGKSKI